MSGCNTGSGYNSLNSYLFGAQKFIKFQGADIIGVEGSNISERLICSNLQMPYAQLLKGRIILQPGQTGYLLNFLGMGDNATFLAIVARYDKNSIFESDNFIEWYFANNPTSTYTLAQSLLLTGNSTNRIQQLYLNNPNTNYSVVLDVMVANIDSTYNFFDNVITQTGTSYTGLIYMNIITQVVDISIAIIASDGITPLTYIALSDILSMENTGTILILDTASRGYIYLGFASALDAYRGMNLINWVMEGTGRVIQDLDPRYFIDVPVMLFTTNVTLQGSTYSQPYYSYQGITFSSNILLSSYNCSITSSDLIPYTITAVTYSQGTISTTASELIISQTTLNTTTYYDTITTYGSYSVAFDYTSVAYDILNPTSIISLNVYTEQPVILFATAVSLPGSTYSPPYYSYQGTTFSATMSLGDYSGTITVPDIITYSIISVTYSMGTISMTNSYVTIADNEDITYTTITETGTYNMTFNLTNATPGLLTPNDVVIITVGD